MNPAVVTASFNPTKKMTHTREQGPEPKFSQRSEQRPGRRPDQRSTQRPDQRSASHRPDQGPDQWSAQQADQQAGPLSTPSQEQDAAPTLGGVKPVLELLERDPAKIDMVLVRKGRRTPDTDRILDLCRVGGVRFTLSDAASLDRLCTAGHQGVVARLFESGFTEFSELLLSAPDAPLPLLLALDQVQDTGNAGTLARTLYALGGAGLIVPRHNGVYLGAGARRAAAGALELLPVARVVNLARALDEARDAGYLVYGAGVEALAQAGQQAREQATTAAEQATADSTRSKALRTSGKQEQPIPSDSVFHSPLHLPAVLVLGSEEHGMRPQVLKRCDHILSVPMLRNFDSLNVAQAGAVLISCFLRAQLNRRAG